MKKKTKKTLISGMAITAFALQIAELGMKVLQKRKGPQTNKNAHSPQTVHNGTEHPVAVG